MRPLARRVALVTGASRGAGRAIAIELGAAGATVIVTGRSRPGRTTEGLAGTIDETAAAVTAAGGEGVALACDHADDAAVAALFARLADEGRALDLLVNNVWGGYEAHPGPDAFMRPFWQQPRELWTRMFDGGVRPSLVASSLAAPSMVARGRGLIVNIVAWAFDAYLGNLVYDAAKSALIRMTFGMAHELRAHGITAVALAPGFMRTERVMAAHAATPFDLSATESPHYLGRAVAALAADAGIGVRSGRLLTVGDLARDYRFTDIDGSQPPAFRIAETAGVG